MPEVIFQSFCDGSSIFDNKIALAVLLELGKERKKSFNQIIDSLNIGKDDIISSLQFLEHLGFIEQNPSQDSSKPFENRNYRLKTKGLIFLQRIKESFPEFKDSLNFFF